MESLTSQLMAEADDTSSQEHSHEMSEGEDSDLQETEPLPSQYKAPSSRGRHSEEEEHDPHL